MPNWNSSAPYEIIASPATLWIAPALTARPNMSLAAFDPLVPGGAWTKIGTSGELNYTEAGVRISLSQDVSKFKSLGDTGSRKAFRVGEDVMVEVNVADLTLAAWAHALNGNTITDVSSASGSTYGVKKMGLSRGPAVNSYGLLVVFPSPYAASLWAHLWLPRAINEGATDTAFVKGDPAALLLRFSAMVNTAAASEDEYYGVIEAQSADLTT
jgi:hypothetical protein